MREGGKGGGLYENKDVVIIGGKGVVKPRSTRCLNDTCTYIPVTFTLTHAHVRLHPGSLSLHPPRPLPSMLIYTHLASSQPKAYTSPLPLSPKPPASQSRDSDILSVRPSGWLTGLRYGTTSLSRLLLFDTRCSKVPPFPWHSSLLSLASFAWCHSPLPIIHRARLFPGRSTPRFKRSPLRLKGHSSSPFLFPRHPTSPSKSP